MKQSTTITFYSGVALGMASSVAIADPFPDSAGIVNAVPTKQICTQVDATHQNCVVANPPLPSAKGAAWGPNYGLQSNNASPGYRLESATFTLSGPHPCTGNDQSPRKGPNQVPWGSARWARCWRISRTDTHVLWGYTIQGEQGQTSSAPNFDNGPGVKFTRGPETIINEAAKLTLVYVKIAPSTP